VLMVMIMIYYPNGFSGFYFWVVAKIKSAFKKTA
jgi:hypothetical protein